jgi:hypothetical protein
MKVFVRTDSLAGGEKPVVIAIYPDDSDVPINAYGEGTTLLNVPMHAIERPPPDTGVGFVLSHNWRDTVGDVPIKAEAKHRIEEAFPISDQLNNLHEMIDAVMKYGIDISKWPAEARRSKTESDKKWNYVSEVRERAKTHVAAMPYNPSSDKIWPRRLMQK